MKPADATLLVVDDNEDNLYTLTRRLKREGYTKLATARDGRQALELLKKHRFDLVLLDIMMPEMDGYQVLEHVKADPALRDIPMIMISALEEIESVIRCVELGAEDYLSKPFSPTLLRARVGASLEKKALRDELRASLARMEQELVAARELQLGMVPQIFPLPTSQRPIEVFAMMEPAREVGGDLYDFFYGPDGTFCFLVGDVSGKGAAAGMFMARTKSLIRVAADLMLAADRTKVGPAEVVARANRELCQNNSEMMFVTLFVGMLNTGNGELQFCNAAHNAPYRVRGSGVDAIQGAKGLALGIMDGANYENCHLSLDSPETIYLFTDGVTEATNEANVLFSEPRLEAVLRGVAREGCESLVQAVTDAIAGFVGSAPQADDITAMAVRWSGVKQ